MYKFKKLKTEKDFQKYSSALQEFEKEFDYPLADKRFTIMHGDNNINYFEFFKRLGDVSYFIVEKNNVIIGAGVAILKNIKDNGNNIKYWYLGDFKITKAYR